MRLAAALGLLVVFLGGGHGSTGWTQPVERVELPELQIGDRWERSNGRTYEVVKRESDHYVVRYLSSTTKGTEHWRGASLGSFVFQRDNAAPQVTYEPAPELLRFPLAVGVQWEFTYRNVLVGASFRRSNKVEGWDTVKVPAGTFQALRVNSVGVRLDNNYRFTETYWYAPEVRGLIKATSDVADPRARSSMEFELLRFVPGAQ